MVQESEIRGRLSGVLLHGADLYEFADWLDGATWDIDRWASRSTRHLAGEIARILAEHDHGHLSMGDVDERLWALASHIEVAVDTIAQPRPASAHLFRGMARANV